MEHKCIYCGGINTEEGRRGDYEGQSETDFYCIDCDDYFEPKES